MSQTIKIKRSTGSSAPSTLANGELAYLNNSTTKKLYIGRPGGSTGDIDVIGGKYYTDVIDARTANSEAAVATTNTSSRTYKVQKDSNDHSVVNVPWVDTNTVYTLPLASSSTRGGVKIGYTESGKNYPVELSSEKMYVNVPWTDTSGDNKLPLAGGTLTGDIVLGDNNKVQFGGTTTNLEIYNDGTTSYITENASGNLEISATDFNIKDGGGQTMMSFDADGSLRIYDQSATNGLPVQRIGTTSVGVSLTGQTTTTSLKFGNETVIVDSIKDEDNMSSNDADSLATQQSIKAYVDASVPTSVANATTAATATNVNLTSLANDSSDTGPKFLTFSDVNSGSQSLETQDVLKYNPDSATLILKNIEIESGLITGPSVITIDPNATGATGEVIIQGDLTVKGTTTTIDSNTISVGDNIIRLNGDLATNATPTQDAGIEVFRGSTSTIQLKWDEQYGTTNAWGAQGQWMITDGTGTNNHYALLATHNAQYETYTIDGGSF
jgi:hypothetical protein